MTKPKKFRVGQQIKELLFGSSQPLSPDVELTEKVGVPPEYLYSGFYCTTDGKFDKEATDRAIQRDREREDHRAKLYWALRSRVLTLEEMAEVEQYDYFLCVRRGRTYQENEVKAEFAKALVNQFKMRLAAERNK